MRRVFAVVAFLAGCLSDNDLIKQPPPQDTQDDDTAVTGQTGEDTEDTQVTDTVTTPSERPVAVCAVTHDQVTPPFQSTIFDGGGSYDPADHPITTYTWTLVTSPTGSAAILVGNNATRQLMPDLAGDYIARLSVKTDDGRVSDPVDCTVTATPGDNLWIEMYWTHATDDMDLHLIAPGGSYKGPFDCYYANTAPSWGEAGTADNPRLDLDDIPGIGPENINIAEPSIAGAYTVLVNDYTGSNGAGRDYMGGNEVTVNIYIGGVLVWNDTHTISNDGAVDYYAEVNWPERTVTPL